MESEHGTAGQRTGVDVLIVDDDPQIVRFMRAVCSSRGISSAGAHNPADGMYAARQERPSVILVDWHMPDGGGADLLRQLRADPATKEIAVVVITADAAPNLRGEATALGARRFLHKPLDPDRLIETVSEFRDPS